MTMQEVLEHYGSRKRLADELGLWPQTVYQWGDTVPLLRQYEIEVRTGGVLKADRPHESA
jgi:hypothetical protein